MIRTSPTGGGPASDFAPSSTLWSDSLPEGLRLGEYEIRHVIGEGGFGIVYLAYDHFLQRQVALKEYMPSTLAGRARTGLDVMVKAERHRETFLAGLRSFVNEARLLAQFDHPALVKVYRFWEAHGTAYMVMPYCVGPTLKEALASHDSPPDEDWLRQHLLSPLLEALALLHKAQCLHRDIAPDNILLTDTGPLLLDFGAARQIIGDMSQTLTVVLKPGYAPIEQYGEVASMGQGAWTDLYALAGVLRYAITGKVPVAATSRILQDTLQPLAEVAQGQYSEVFLQAVDAALAIKPADRPQNVEQFQALLEGPRVPNGQPVPSPQSLALSADATPATPPALPRAVVGPKTVPKRAVHAADAAAPTTGPRSWSPTTRPAPLDPPTAGASMNRAANPVAAPSSAQAGSRLGLAVAGMVALSAVGAGAWWLMQQGDVAPAVNLPDTRQAPAAVALPKPRPAAASAPITAPAPAPVAMAPPATSPSPAPSPASAPVAAITPPATTRPTPAAEPSPPPVVAKAAPVTPARVDPAPTAEVVSTPKRASPTADRSARCSDILQKASLEPLLPSEAAFLKSECK